MIRAAAVALSELWARNGVIAAEDAEAYQYGLELLFSTVLNIVLMVVISIAAGHAWLFIPYLVAFIPLRLSAGGYHAMHHFSCIAFNTLVYSAGIVAASRLSAPGAVLACILVSGLSLVLIFLFAPVPAVNKPLSKKEHGRNRKISLALGFLLLLLCMILYFTNGLCSMWSKMMYCGQAVAMLLMVTGNKKLSIFK